MFAHAATAPPPAVHLPKIVHARAIHRSPHTLPPGRTVGASKIAVRTFPGSGGFGVGLTRRGGVGYPAMTTDGGQAWKIDGPALDEEAAQAPLAVTTVSATGPEVQFAYGAGNVVDTTSDGGLHWYRSLFEGIPMAVVPGYRGSLIALVDMTPRGDGGPTWQYVSHNGGRLWRYTTAAGGGT